MFMSEAGACLSEATKKSAPEDYTMVYIFPRVKRLKHTTIQVQTLLQKPYDVSF
jgi:hypothetical protein